MILDLRVGKPLPPDKIKLFGDVALRIRTSYNDIIQALGEKNKNDYRWWFTDLASRNTFSSDLYLYLCYLAFVDELLTQGVTIERILTDSYSLAKTLKTSKVIVKEKIDVVFNFSPWIQLKSIAFPILKFIYVDLRSLIRYFKIRRTRIKNLEYPGDICLIDMFIINNSFDQGFYNDRYFGNFMQYFSDSEKTKFYYTPTFIVSKDFSSIVKKMRSSDQKFIVKEDFVTFIDLVRSLLLPLRLTLFKVGHPVFLSYQIRPLLLQAKFRNLTTSSMGDAFLKHQFAKRLKIKDVKIRMVIDWFENQVIDKGFNMGFRKFFPDIIHKGYQVVLGHKLYMCFYPTTQEQTYKVLPQEIAVSGKGFVSGVKEFCPDLRVSVAPSLRYQHVWRNNKYIPDNKYFTILLALPSFKKEALRILELTSQIIESVDTSYIRFWVKLHPTTSVETLKLGHKKKWPDQFQVLTGPLEDFIEKSDLVISNNSSLCLEVVAKGLPIIIVGNLSGITHIPLPDIIDKDFWRLCFDERELLESISFFLNQTLDERRKNRELGLKYRELFFEPVNQKTVRSFFQFN